LPLRTGTASSVFDVGARSVPHLCLRHSNRDDLAAAAKLASSANAVPTAAMLIGRMHARITGFFTVILYHWLRPTAVAVSLRTMSVPRKVRERQHCLVLEQSRPWHEVHFESDSLGVLEQH
jgi:hypothetical protein